MQSGTHSFVSEQVVFNGRATVVLLDPFYLNGIALFFRHGLQFGGIRFPYTGQNKELQLVNKTMVLI